MLSFLNRLSLIRYLIVWRVNSSVVYFPRYLSIDISMAIGSIISHRLPTKEVTPWRKALDPLIESFINRDKNQLNKLSKIFDVSWPIDSVIFVYPDKKTYGRDELIFWELKLFGEHADHGLFLEVILPAMEEASYTVDTQWNRRNRLWGHFDIQSVYVARGHCWEPIVKDGKLDLRYRANPSQWLEQLSLKPKTARKFKNLTWIAPFDLSEVPIFDLQEFGLTVDKNILRNIKAPTLSMILIGLISRLSQLIAKSAHPAKISSIMNAEDKTAFHEALDRVLGISVIKHNIEPVPRTWPGKWLGAQQFSTIPESAIPYLELASILHIGKQIHFGCGTFEIT